MADREKVIRKMECIVCPNRFCGNCMYFVRNENDPNTGWCDRDAIYKDALELLKAQEPRVMTLEQLLDKQEFSENTRPVWFEYVHGNVKAVVLLYTEYREDEDTVTTIGTGAYVQESWIQGKYGKTWRCWTSKPTDEQRKAVKWE